MIRNPNEVHDNAEPVCHVRVSGKLILLEPTEQFYFLDVSCKHPESRKHGDTIFKQFHYV